MLQFALHRTCILMIAGYGTESFRCFQKIWPFVKLDLTLMEQSYFQSSLETKETGPT